MHSVSSWIWIRVAVFISNDNNYNIIEKNIYTIVL